MAYPIFTILEAVSKIPDKKKRISALQKAANESPAICEILKLALTPGVEFKIPPSFDYQLEHIGTNLDSQLHFYAKKLWKVTDETSIVNPSKRLQYFLTILGSVCAEDASLVMDIKEKKFPFKKTLTLNFVKEALPGLIDEQKSAP